jgi:hypothetical protein
MNALASKGEWATDMEKKAAYIGLQAFYNQARSITPGAENLPRHTGRG